MHVLEVQRNRASWVQQNFITEDTQALNARANQEYIDAIARLAKESTNYNQTVVPTDQRRQLDLLKLSLVRWRLRPIQRKPRS